jgi:hypothetical protein
MDRWGKDGSNTFTIDLQPSSKDRKLIQAPNKYLPPVQGIRHTACGGSREKWENGSLQMGDIGGN